MPSTATATTIGIAHPKIGAPGIAGMGAGPRRVFPFGLCQEPVFLASQLREPAYILLGVAPVHVDHRHLSTSPTVCNSRARGCGDASIPFFECHLELGNGE